MTAQQAKLPPIADDGILGKYSDVLLAAGVMGVCI